VKLQCDLCREIVVADFAVDGDAIRVHCPACDGSFRVGATATTSAQAAPTETAPPPPRLKIVFDGPSMACPKCGLVQAPAPGCRSCGLRADRMADYEANRDAHVPPEVAAAWAAAQASWTDAGLHERLANVAALHDAYAWIARAYRDHLRANPTDPISADRIARITRITEASLRASAAVRGVKGAAPGAKPHRPYSGAIAILIALVLVIVAGTIYALASTSEPAPDVPPIPVGAPP
jgi:hypothetical protein